MFPQVSCSNPFGQILHEVSLSAFCFSGPGPVVVSGCRNAVCGRAVVFHFRQSRARQPFVISTLDPLSEHFRGRNALGFARRRTAGGGAAPQLSTNSISSPSRGGCFMKRFSADVVYWPLAHRNSQLLSALATYCLPPANLSRSLLADFCSSSPTSSVALCFRCVRFVGCAGVKADPW